MGSAAVISDLSPLRASDWSFCSQLELELCRRHPDMVGGQLELAASGGPQLTIFLAFIFDSVQINPRERIVH